MKAILYIALLFPVFSRGQGFIAKSAGTGTWKGIGTPGYVMRFKLPVAPSAGKDTAFFNLNLTEQITAANWANLTGDPNLSVRTASINGISITTGATARWKPYTNAGCNCSAFTDNGNASATYGPAQVVKEDWFSFNAGVSNQDLYADGAWKFQVSGLKPGHTYNFTLSGSLGAGFSGFTASTEYRVQGTATVGPTTINCITNTATVATITITADGSGNAFVYVNAASGNDLGVVDHIKIIEP